MWQLVERIQIQFPGLPNAHWVALRLLDGDASIEKAIRERTLGDLARNNAFAPVGEPAIRGAAS